MMCDVGVQADRVWDFYGHRPDPNFDAQAEQRIHDESIKIRHSSRLQGNYFGRAVGALHDELMIDEIKRHRE